MSQQFRTIALRKAQQHGIPPELFLGLVGRESGWNAQAVSPVGARGLTQLMPGTARDLGVRNPFDPEQALDGGARYLADQFKRFGTWGKALAAYNAGPGNVVKYGGVPPFKETQAYVRELSKLIRAGAATAATLAPPVASATPPAPGGVAGNDTRRAVGEVLLANQQALGSGLSAFLKAPVLRGSRQQTSPIRDVTEQLARVVIAPRIEQGAQRVQGGPPGNVAAGAMMGASGTQLAPGSGAVDKADDYLGTPYSWGGGSPSGPTRGIGRGAGTVGFDCSALVQMAWARAGVKLPRTTYDQIKSGRAVGSLAEAKPGDLIFPHLGHVQMYIGNGRVIEAPFTGGKVRIVPMGKKAIAIRRPGG